MIIVKVLLIVVAAVLLLCAGVTVYTGILLKRRPPTALYGMLTRQAGFLPLSRIPKRQIELLVAVEDPTFYTHHGFALEGIRKAAEENSRAGRIVRGGSTITQQLVKNLYFRFTRSYLRKMSELLIALALERRLGKARILEMYVNIIYFGNGIYGINDASRFYFEKAVTDLSLNQMFMLACIPAVPTRGNPIQHPEVFERVRNGRLERLIEEKQEVLSPAEMASISAHKSDCLDPDLRKPDDFTRNYPQTVPLINERFGPFPQSVQHRTNGSIGSL